jgi:hypothetical protein
MSANEFDENAPSSYDKQRLYERSRLVLDVYFNGADLTGVASTRDISLGGLYMNTMTEIPAGSQLVLRIPLQNGQQIVVEAEVVYSNPGRGVGVRFSHLTDEVRNLLTNELPAP